MPGCGTAIGLEKHGRLVAGVLFDNFNGANVNMHVASDGSKNWMSREYLWYCFHYPFRQLGVKRITGVVAESNKAAQSFDEHIGFELETRLKDAAPDGDLLIYVMTPDKCRWLERKSHGRKIVSTSGT